MPLAVLGRPKLALPTTVFHEGNVTWLSTLVASKRTSKSPNDRPIEPFITNIPKETLQFTLQATRTAVLKQVAR